MWRRLTNSSIRPVRRSGSRPFSACAGTARRLSQRPRGKRIFALSSLAGQLLVAMPQLEDPRFERSVIFLCAHNETAAMGLVVNKLIGSLTLGELLVQLEIPAAGLIGEPRVHFGVPLQQERGFVLHSADYTEKESLTVGGDLALTATPDILRAIGRGEGPRRSL